MCFFVIVSLAFIKKRLVLKKEEQKTLCKTKGYVPCARDKSLCGTDKKASREGRIFSSLFPITNFECVPFFSRIPVSSKTCSRTQGTRPYNNRFFYFIFLFLKDRVQKEIWRHSAKCILHKMLYKFDEKRRYECIQKKNTGEIKNTKKRFFVNEGSFGSGGFCDYLVPRIGSQQSHTHTYTHEK